MVPMPGRPSSPPALTSDRPALHHRALLLILCFHPGEEGGRPTRALADRHTSAALIPSPSDRPRQSRRPVRGSAG
jgi:hypothetical protein